MTPGAATQAYAACEPPIGAFQSRYPQPMRQRSFRFFHMPTSFKTIRARAEKRKGGAKMLQKLLPAKPEPKALAQTRCDDRVLAEMTRRVFSRGLCLERHRQQVGGLRRGLSAALRRASCRMLPDSLLLGRSDEGPSASSATAPRSCPCAPTRLSSTTSLKEQGSFGKFLAKLAFRRRNRTARSARQTRQPV